MAEAEKRTDTGLSGQLSRVWRLSVPAIRYAVDQLLPQGLHILAGAPKAGKSWLALWLCLCVSKGDAVWGFCTEQSPVLYLCLEDSYARIQSRLFQLAEDAPPTLHFANLPDSIGNGLEEQIREFLSARPQTKLVARPNVHTRVKPKLVEWQSEGHL